ncbi:MAG: sel1 repeat family protein [Muribaculaceae bacterium]|nr:sel1 repeat family protein [Muribaculaceae bacterium]
MIRLIILALTTVLPGVSRAASPGEVAASAMEGYELFMRDSLPDDRQKGYDLMLSAAWEGDAKAANNIGWLLQHGEFVEKDLKGAFRWYERAADQGLPAASLNYMELILNAPEDVLAGKLPDKERMAKASALAGTAMLMGRGLPYDSKRGEDLLLRAALFGDQQAMTTVAQQLEMYPDSFSYLPLEEIAEQCDSLLPECDKNIPEGMTLSEFADHMLSPAFWYSRLPNE